MSARLLNEPPRFGNPIPSSGGSGLMSFRELYIGSLGDINLQDAVASPFFTVHYLLRLNRHCWHQIIQAICNEDRRIHGISDTSVGHSEDIKDSLAIVKRGVSLSWKGADNPSALQCKEALEEDFKSLVEQMDTLWQTREKLSTIRQQRSETRWSTLTNAFTYL